MHSLANGCKESVVSDSSGRLCGPVSLSPSSANPAVDPVSPFHAKSPRVRAFRTARRRFDDSRASPPNPLSTASRRHNETAGHTSINPAWVRITSHLSPSPSESERCVRSIRASRSARRLRLDRRLKTSSSRRNRGSGLRDRPGVRSDQPEFERHTIRAPRTPPSCGSRRSRACSPTAHTGIAQPWTGG